VLFRSPEGEGTNLQFAICNFQFAISPSSRRGVTLVELLVVISILVLLAAATISSVRGTLEERRVREAGRALSVYLGSARNRALETGRPCGIAIQRFGTTAPLNSFAMIVEQVEVPPPYAGDLIGAVAFLSVSNSQPGVSVTLKATFGPPINAAMVNVGDTIQFNGQGPPFAVASGENLGQFNKTCSNVTTQPFVLGGGQLTPWMFNQPPNGVPYKIYRRPMKGPASPLQLPSGAVIDLQFSGWDGGDFSTGTNPIVILFSPNGSLDRLYCDSVPNGVQSISLPIYLLVGKRERVGGGADGIFNWQDLHNRWIAMNPQTGLLATAEIYYTQQTGAPGLAESRTYAKKFQSMGGR
jgi:prepilin-type N-terminal cleavage/methylation domain-containing protein